MKIVAVGGVAEWIRSAFESLIVIGSQVDVGGLLRRQLADDQLIGRGQIKSVGGKIGHASSVLHRCGRRRRRRGTAARCAR